MPVPANLAPEQSRMQRCLPNTACGLGHVRIQPARWTGFEVGFNLAKSPIEKLCPVTRHLKWCRLQLRGRVAALDPRECLGNTTFPRPPVATAPPKTREPCSRAPKESVDGWPTASTISRQSGVIRSLYPLAGVTGGWKPPPERRMSPGARGPCGQPALRRRTVPWGTQWGQLDGPRAPLPPMAPTNRSGPGGQDSRPLAPTV